MAYLWGSVFGLNSTGTSIEWDTINAGFTIVTSPVLFAGEFAGQVSVPAGTVNARIQYAAADVLGKRVHGFYMYLDALPTGGTRDIALVADTASASKVKLSLTTAGQLRVRDVANVQIGSDSAVLALKRWYFVEISVDSTTLATTAVDVRLDEVSFASGTINITNGQGRFLIGCSAADAIIITFAHVAISDDSTGAPTSWQGRRKIETLGPNAAGDVNTFATQTGGTAGSGNNFTRVNEVTPDDATTFNGSSTLNQEDLFNFTNPSLSSGVTIPAVHVNGRFRNSTADTAAAIKFELEKAAAGTKTQSAAIVPNSTTWNTNSLAAPRIPPIRANIDPDGAAWTPTTANSLQAGYKLTTGPGTAGRRVDVTKVWLTFFEILETTEKLFDYFTGVTIDAAKWTTVTFNSGAVSQNGQITITPANSTLQSEGDLDSVFRFNFIGSYVQVKVVQVANTNVQTQLNVIAADGNNGYLFYQYNGNLLVDKVVAGVQTNVASIAYNASTMLYWRMREASGVSYFEYSSDRVTWTELTHFNNVFQMGAVKIQLSAFEAVSTATPGAAIFDEFNVLTTQQAQTGKSRIRVSTTKTQAGKSRISVSTTRTQTGVSRIRKTVLQTQTGKSRIRQLLNKLQTGVSRMTASTTRTQAGKGRITISTTQTQTGKANIRNTTIRTQTGKSRIQKIVNQLQAGLSRITASVSQNQTGKARITASTSRAQTGKSDIRAVANKLQTGLSRIQKEINTTITGKSRIEQSATQTQQGQSRITTSVSENQTGVSRIKKIVSRTQTGVADIRKTTSQTQAGKARVQKVVTRTITGVTLITAVVNKNQTGKSRIQKTTTKLQTGISRIRKTVLRTQTGISRIRKVVAQVITGKARIRVSVIRNQTGRTRIQVVVNQTQAGKAALVIQRTKTQTGTAQISAKTLRTITGIADIRATTTQTITGKAHILPLIFNESYVPAPRDSSIARFKAINDVVFSKPETTVNSAKSVNEVRFVNLD